MIIEPVEPVSLERLTERREFDLLIGALGYERRSSQIPLALAAVSQRTVLIDLGGRNIQSYNKNQKSLAGLADVVSVPVSDLPRWLLQQLVTLNEIADSARVAVDISCLPRDRVAGIIEGVLSADSHVRSATVEILYTPAQASLRSQAPEPIEVLGPVSPRFAGFSPKPDTPVVAFVGLGVEQDRAIGALEYLEPATVWAFQPFGEDERYDHAVHEANSWIWRIVPEWQRISYRVDDPYSLYGALEQLVFSELEHARPVIVPLGPKMFAAVAMLVSGAHPQVGVWRVTAGRFAKPMDHLSNGKVISLRLNLENLEIDSR